MKYDFKSDIRDRNGFSEPIFDFEDPEFLWIFCLWLIYILSYISDGFDNILYAREGTFGSDHITDDELKLFFILQLSFNLILITPLVFIEKIL